MFTTPAAAAPTLSTTTQPASPTSPTRPGRLRGLSYLRNYTHQHFNSRSDERSPAGRRPSFPRARSTPSPTDADTNRRSGPPSSNSLTATTNNINNNIQTTLSRQALVDGATDTQSGWVPTVGGRSVLSRTATSAEPSTSTPLPTTTMTRNRAESAAPSLGVAHHGPPATNGIESIETPTPAKQLPSIRFIPHDDPRATRPSLQFPVISRTLPSEDCVIRVGRYSEKDNIPQDLPSNVPSSAPVGFKSKVVSRRHCEFWCTDGQWWIKDVKSSSGTFLNHIRLSQPGVESKPYKIGDGDVVQLGIDFRGGEEMIFRCVKIRIELNRNWQKALNNFNKSTHKRLRNLALSSKSKDSDSASVQSTDCSICLMSIRPCQALFVAPCSHVWHYKCIARIINGPTYPQFMCPNCRMVNDLDADVSEPEDWEEQEEDDLEEAIAESKLVVVNGETRKSEEEGEGTTTPRATGVLQSAEAGESTSAGAPATPAQNSVVTEEELANALADVSIAGALINAGSSSDDQTSDTGVHTPPEDDFPAETTSSPSANVAPMPILNATPAPAITSSPFGEATMLNATPGGGLQYAPTPTPDVSRAECPMTPRNNAGPFVLDGSAGGGSSRSSEEGVPLGPQETTVAEETPSIVPGAA